jgi:hypothetical protein
MKEIKCIVIPKFYFLDFVDWNKSFHIVAEICLTNFWVSQIYPVFSTQKLISFSIRLLINPFTGDFDLLRQLRRICLKGLFWFSFDIIRHFSSKFSTDVTKKVFFALSDASKMGFCNLNIFFFQFWKNLHFWIS